nr:HD subdomain, putative isoform 1 [Tanacetum cinerariifolium]
MREYIRNVVKESGLVEKVKGKKIDLVIGSNGSIRMIKKANFMRWNKGLVNEIGLFEVLLDDKDLEYLEADCLLHNIGLINGKKGYHKRSYHIIMNGEHLHGYNAEDVKIIALFARHHKKKILKLNHDSLSEFTDEMKHKMRGLCTIIRLSEQICRPQSKISKTGKKEGSEVHWWRGVKKVVVERRRYSGVMVVEEIKWKMKKRLNHRVKGGKMLKYKV